MTENFRKYRRITALLGSVLCLLVILFIVQWLKQSFQINVLAESNQVGFWETSIVLSLIIGTFVSEDLTCLTAGTLVSQGKLSFGFALLGCGLGIVIGDTLIFLAGRIWGRTAIQSKLFRRFISEESLRQGSLWLEKYGILAVLMSRFTFGLRLPVYFLAGTLKTNLAKFIGYFLFATVIWTPFIIGFSALAGEKFLNSTIFGQNIWLGIAVFVISVFIVLRFLLKMTTWKGRRLLLGSLKRWTNWEFWSLKVFYFPVLLWIAWLAVKYRSLTVFTCSNPSIPAGGFVGESKDEIYQGLSNEITRSFLLPYVVINEHLSAEEKLLKAKQFLVENSLSFPVVLKPDSGQRGAGVKIVKSETELGALLLETQQRLLLQEFADGQEASVFYYRFPEQPSGKIFSITDKQFPKLIGDGKSTLEELILRDNRCICLADKYFEANRSRLNEIPQLNEPVQIIEIGTHARGAIFLDGARLFTKDLERKIDEICRSFQGFYFGRFDIRYASTADFQTGNNFKIIELNGVTSESTNIYDPKNSLITAYQTLFKQWQIAFEIGSQNKRNGAKPSSVSNLLKLWFEHLTGVTTSSSKSFE
jgi:membrane protein DedA with SNARE-associated domain